MTKTLVFASNSDYQRVRTTETHKIVSATHVFVKNGDDTYNGIKGPHSGRVVTARTVERLSDASQ